MEKTITGILVQVVVRNRHRLEVECREITFDQLAALGHLADRKDVPYGLFHISGLELNWRHLPDNSSQHRARCTLRLRRERPNAGASQRLPDTILPELSRILGLGITWDES